MLLGFIAFLIVLVLLAAIPVTLTFKVLWQQSLRGNIALDWAFGLIHTNIPLTQNTQTRKKKTKKKKKPNADLSSNTVQNLSSLAALRKQNNLLQRLLLFVTDISKSIKKDDLQIHFFIGLDNPADTGKLWAIAGPLSGVLHSVKNIDVGITPDFNQEIFYAQSNGAIRFIPLQILYLFFLLLCSPTIWYGIYQLQKNSR